jgi:hypothetical protein
VGALAFAAVAQAGATLFYFSYSDVAYSGDDTVSGVLSAQLLSGDQYLVTSGTVNVSDAYTIAEPGGVEAYSIVNCTNGGVVESPSGAFYVDNIVLVGGGLVAEDPVLDNIGGLLFAPQANVQNGVETLTGDEINIWGGELARRLFVLPRVRRRDV